MADVEKQEGADGNSGHALNPSGQPIWDPSRAYAPRQPSRIGNPGALYDLPHLIPHC